MNQLANLKSIFTELEDNIKGTNKSLTEDAHRQAYDSLVKQTLQAIARFQQLPCSFCLKLSDRSRVASAG